MSEWFNRLAQHAAERPSAIALRHCRGGGVSTTTTYADLLHSAQAFAHALYAQSIDSPVIPLLLGKTSECVAAMLGIIGAGKAFACLNRKLRLPQVNTILSRTGPTLALVDGPGVMTLAADINGIGAVAQSRWRVLDHSTLAPPQRKAIELLQPYLDISPWLSPAGTISPPVDRATAVDPNLPACCLFTSGSTGTPKGVLISETDLIARAQAEVDWFGLTERDVLLSILPFSFDVGLNQLLSALTAGCELVFLDSWLPADILRATAQHQVTGISGVPSIWSDMLRANARFNTAGDHRALRYITLSGGDLPPQQLQSLPSLAPGVGIHKTYGQSEAFRTAALRPEEFSCKPRSVGRPFHGVNAFILREDGSPAACGQEGEIVHTGLGVMLGYLGESDSGDKLRRVSLSAESGRLSPAIFTGDIGYFDPEGYLYVRGRRDAMLKVAGNRVYPAEIAAQMVSLAGIAEAEVVGVKDKEGETTLVAFIVRNAQALKFPGESVQEIRRQLIRILPSYMVPRHLEELDAIPRTSSGKPDRPQLADRAVNLIAGMEAGVILPR